MPVPISEIPPRVAVARPSMTFRQLRDLVGLVLVALGVIGLVTTAWLWHPLAGMAATSLACIGAGIALGYDW